MTSQRIKTATSKSTDLPNDVLEEAKAALKARNWERVQELLTPFSEAKPSGIAAFFLSRALLELGKVAQASTYITSFHNRRPDHAGGLYLMARLSLAQGADVAADEFLEKALRNNPDLGGVQKFKSQLEKFRRDKQSQALLDILNEDPTRTRKSRPLRAMVDAAEQLAAMDPGKQWNNDPLDAALAYFHFSKDPKKALRNYDPDLIRASVEFDYVSWPKRIQNYIRGGSVLDLGCGYGGYGVGFLIAGATSYTGLDPVMDLDSTRTRNKRTRQPAELLITPREISQRLPAIHLVQGKAEDLKPGTKYDVISLHNVTEHLMQLEYIFGELTGFLKPKGKVIFTHHNYYCWNGHHQKPIWPSQLDLDDPEHQQLYDWRHIKFAETAPNDHYVRTHLNRIRLQDIKALTRKHFEIEVWDEMESTPETLARLTPKIIKDANKRMPGLTENELTTNLVFCVATRK